MGPALYGDLADWFHLLTAPEDYAEEASLYHRLIVESAVGGVDTVLELGCGGGNNASHLKHHFEMTLTDLSPAMLEVSRGLNPECRHIEGDMRTLRLGELFDAVFAHDAVSYLRSRDEAEALAKTAATHCRPGGVVLLVPDFVRESFRTQTKKGGHDGSDRALRYLQWTRDPDPEDHEYVVDMAMLMRLPDGSVEHALDRHLCGLFERATWLAAIDKAGFEAKVEQIDLGDDEGRDLFLGIRKPRAS